MSLRELLLKRGDSVMKRVAAMRVQIMLIHKVTSVTVDSSAMLDKTPDEVKKFQGLADGEARRYNESMLCKWNYHIVKVHTEEELFTMLKECGRNCWELVHIEHTIETPRMSPVKKENARNGRLYTEAY